MNYRKLKIKITGLAHKSYQKFRREYLDRISVRPAIKCRVWGKINRGDHKDTPLHTKT